MKKIQISYVGVNNLFGRVATSLLQQSPGIKKLILYDDSEIKRNGKKEESAQNETIVAELSGRNYLPEALENADLIVFGDESEADISATGVKLKNAAKRICDYIEVLGAVNCSKKVPPVVVVATSPLNIFVPLIAGALEAQQLYVPGRLLGATSGDTFRASVLLASYMRIQPGGVIVPVVGGSSQDTRVPLFSQMHPQLALSEETRDKLIQKTRNLDQETSNVTEIIERAYTTVRFLSSILSGFQGKKNIPEISMVRTDKHPDVEFLSIPMILGKQGIERCIAIPKLSPFEEDMLEKAVQALKKDASTAKNVLQEIKVEKDSATLQSRLFKNEDWVEDVDMGDFDNKECLKSDVEPIIAARKSKSENKIKEPSSVSKATAVRRTQSTTITKSEGIPKIQPSSQQNKTGDAVTGKKEPIQTAREPAQASGDKIIKRKRGRSSSRRGKKLVEATGPSVAKPSVTLKSNPETQNQFCDSMKSMVAPESPISPKIEAKETNKGKLVSNKVAAVNEPIKKQEVETSQPQTQKKTDTGNKVKPDEGKSERPKTELFRADKKKESHIPKITESKNEPEVKKEFKEEAKVKASEENQKIKKYVRTNEKHEKCSASTLEAVHEESDNAEKSRKVTSYSYSAFVDSLPQHKRPAIESPVEFCSTESLPTRSQTGTKELTRDKSIKETKQLVTRTKPRPPSKGKRLKQQVIRKQANSPTVTNQQTTTRTETKKYERFREFAGIIEKVNNEGATKQDVTKSIRATKKQNEKAAGESTKETVSGKVDRTPMIVPESASKELNKPKNELDSQKKEESRSASGKNGNEDVAEDSTLSNPKSVEETMDRKKEEHKVQKSEAKKVEESTKTPQSTPVLFETRSRSPARPKSPAKSPSRTQSRPKSSNPHAGELLPPISEPKTQRIESTELKQPHGTARPEDYSTDKAEHSQSLQSRAAQTSSMTNKPDEYKHEKKSSAYMKFALQNFSLSRTPQPVMKAPPTGNRRPKQRVSKLGSLSSIPRRMPTETDAVKKDKPSTGNKSRKLSKNTSRTKKDSSAKLCTDQTPKSSSPDTVANDFKHSLIPSQLTSDKNKHEAPHVVNFKINNVSAKPNINQIEGPSKPSPSASTDRNPPYNAVKNLLVNQKVTLSRSLGKSLEEETCQMKKKTNYLDNLKTIDSYNSQIVEQNESKWGKIFYVFRQVLKNDLKREEERKLTRKSPTRTPGKLDRERRRSNKPTDKKEPGRARSVMVNVSSETFKPSRGNQGNKPCPTKLKKYFSRRGNISQNPPETC